MFDDPQKLAKVFASANAVLRPLLRSPLHRIASGRLMLLSYTGGKTGNQYTFAVGYFPWDGGDVLVSSSANWPKTLGMPAMCAYWSKASAFTAKPTVIKDAEQKADVLAEFVRRNGAQAAKGLMLGLPGDRQPDRQQLLAAGAKTTFVCFALEPEAETP